MSVTIRDIARALNIDPSTVSSCLSGNCRKRRISKKLSDTVNAKAAEMGYIPNRLAGRIFGRNNRKNIALIFKNDTAGARNLPVLEHAIRFLGERNDCDFSVFYSKTSDLQEALRNGIGFGIRDFLVIGYMRGCDFAKSKLEKLPPIRIYASDYYFDESDREFPSVVCKIGFNREAFYRSLRDRYEKAWMGPVKLAYALEPGQKKPKEKDAITYRVAEIKDLFLFGKEKIAPAVIELVKSGKCRTLLLRNDAMAVGVMEELLAHKIRIPKDLALIGFNNAPFSAYAKVPLTTIALPQKENIEKILRHLLEDVPLPPVIETMPELIIRDSAPSS